MKKVMSWVGISLITLAMIAVVVGNVIALGYSEIISKALGHATSKIVNSEASTVDSNYFKSEFSTAQELKKAGEELAEEIEAEGMVLLKNEGNQLPLGKNKKISLFSESSVDFVYGGGGSGSVDTSKALNFRQAFEAVGYSVNNVLWDFYLNNSYKKEVPELVYGDAVGDFKMNEAPQSTYTDAVKSSYGQFSDSAVVVISRVGCEGKELFTVSKESVNGSIGGGSYLELTDDEKAIFGMLETNAAFDNVVVIVNSSNALELGFLDNYSKVKAALWVGSVGQTGIKAIPKVFTGEVNPSGRLVDTYAYDVMNNPSMSNFSPLRYTNFNDYASEVDLPSWSFANYIVFQEGIYTGYRYYETRYEDSVMSRGNTGTFDYLAEVQYPFGHGLSFTSFAYSDYALVSSGDNFEISVTVKNTGTVAGKEVVQIYMQSPYTDYDKQNNIEKSSVELVGFAKTEVIEPNASKTVKVTVAKEEMKSYDAKTAKTYIVDAGDYYFATGKNANDALNNILAAKGVSSAKMTSAGNADLAEKVVQQSFDKVKYSKSSATGNTITNQFDNAELSSFDKNVTYLSRNNWTGTYPTQFTGLSLNQKMATDMKNQGIGDVAVENVVMPKTGVDNKLKLITYKGADFDDELWENLLDQVTAEEMYKLVQLGGYGTQMMESISKPATEDRDGPAGISGELVSIGVECMAYPSEVVIASTFNVELAERMGELVGEDGLASKVTGWYAPSMNSHRNAFGGRNFEYYSEDPVLSGMMGSAVVTGAESKGLICYIKHFAGNELETSRHGLSSFFNEQTLRELYLKPFETSVVSGKASGVMSSFNRLGVVWAGGHKGLLTEVLREEWGFKGIVVTDYAGTPIMEMAQGLAAGNDLWLNTNAITADFVIADYKTNAKAMTLLRKATHSILYAVVNSNAMNGITQDSRVVRIMPTWQTWLIAGDVAVGVLGLGGIGMIVYFSFIRKKKRTA